MQEHLIWEELVVFILDQKILKEFTTSVRPEFRGE